MSRKSERSQAEAMVQHAICYLASWFYFDWASRYRRETHIVKEIAWSVGDVAAINLLCDARRELYEESEKATT